MEEKRMHVETALIHGAYEAEAGTGATTYPIVQSSAFAYDSAEAIEAVFAGREAGFVYSRIANPTVDRFERRMALLEGGLGAIAAASGMASIAAVAVALCGEGGEIVAGSGVFGGTYSLFDRTLRRLGLRTRWVEAPGAEAYRAAITDRTRLVFAETIGNPRLDVPDVAAIAAVARAAGVALVVDSTVTTPVLVRPRDLGADVVVHSASKFIDGHGRAIGGVAVDAGTCDWAGGRYPHLKPFHDRVGRFALLAALRNQVQRDLGGCLSPFHAFLFSAGLETLAVRMERHCRNALRLAETLAADGRVAEVRYPGLERHPDHATARRQFDGRYGAILTLRLGSKERCFRFIRGLRLAQNLANIGDAKTLVIHPASTFCRDATEAERSAMGVSDDLVRLAVGLEHVDDILADMDAALGAA